MNFFASKIRQKSPAELVKIFRENSARLDAGYASNNSMEIRKVSSFDIASRRCLFVSDHAESGTGERRDLEEPVINEIHLERRSWR